MDEVLLKSDSNEYKGFLIVTKFFKHLATGNKRKEVTIDSWLAPAEVSNRLKLVLLENSIDYFSTEKAAEDCINRCYTGVSRTGRT